MRYRVVDVAVMDPVAKTFWMVQDMSSVDEIVIVADYETEAEAVADAARRNASPQKQSPSDG